MRKKETKTMKKVAIKRVQKQKKKASAREKILAGLGLGATLLGGVSMAPGRKPSQAPIVAKQSTQAASERDSLKDKLSRFFDQTIGIPKAKADDEDEEYYDDGGDEYLFMNVSRPQQNSGGGGDFWGALGNLPTNPNPVDMTGLSQIGNSLTAQSGTQDQNTVNNNLQTSSQFSAANPTSGPTFSNFGSTMIGTNANANAAFDQLTQMSDFGYQQTHLEEAQQQQLQNYIASQQANGLTVTQNSDGSYHVTGGVANVDKNVSLNEMMQLASMPSTPSIDPALVNLPLNQMLDPFVSVARPETAEQVDGTITPEQEAASNAALTQTIDQVLATAPPTEAGPAPEVGPPPWSDQAESGGDPSTAYTVSPQMTADLLAQTSVGTVVTTGDRVNFGTGVDASNPATTAATSVTFENTTDSPEIYSSMAKNDLGWVGVAESITKGESAIPGAKLSDDGTKIYFEDPITGKVIAYSYNDYLHDSPLPASVGTTSSHPGTVVTSTFTPGIVDAPQTSYRVVDYDVNGNNIYGMFQNGQQVGSQLFYQANDNKGFVPASPVFTDGELVDFKPDSTLPISSAPGAQAPAGSVTTVPETSYRPVGPEQPHIPLGPRQESDESQPAEANKPTVVYGWEAESSVPASQPQQPEQAAPGTVIDTSTLPPVSTPEYLNPVANIGLKSENATETGVVGMPEGYEAFSNAALTATINQVVNTTPQTDPGPAPAQNKIEEYEQAAADRLNNSYITITRNGQDTGTYLYTGDGRIYNSEDDTPVAAHSVSTTTPTSAQPAPGQNNYSKGLESLLSFQEALKEQGLHYVVQGGKVLVQEDPKEKDQSKWVAYDEQEVRKGNWGFDNDGNIVMEQRSAAPVRQFAPPPPAAPAAPASPIVLPEAPKVSISLPSMGNPTSGLRSLLNQPLYLPVVKNGQQVENQYIGTDGKFYTQNKEGQYVEADPSKIKALTGTVEATSKKVEEAKAKVSNAVTGKVGGLAEKMGLKKVAADVYSGKETKTKDPNAPAVIIKDEKKNEIGLYELDKGVFMDADGYIYVQSGKGKYTYAGLDITQLDPKTAGSTNKMLGPKGELLDPLGNDAFKDSKGNIYTYGQDGSTQPTGLKLNDKGVFEVTKILTTDNKTIDKSFLGIVESGAKGGLKGLLTGNLVGIIASGAGAAVDSAMTKTTEAVIKWATDPKKIDVPGQITFKDYQGKEVTMDKFTVQAMLQKPDGQATLNKLVEGPQKDKKP